jgi:hypothetical protein
LFEILLLRLVVTDLSPQKPKFDLRPLCVRLLVNKVILGLVLLQVLQFSTLSIILQRLNTHSPTTNATALKTDITTTTIIIVIKQQKNHTHTQNNMVVTHEILPVTAVEDVWNNGHSAYCNTTTHTTVDYLYDFPVQ